MTEPQQRPHAVDEQREPAPQETAAHASPAAEPPAFLVRQEAATIQPPREEASRQEVVEPARQDSPRAEVAGAEAPPKLDPKRLLEESGLVMIETDRSKAVTVQPPAPEEPVRLGRPRRDRPKPPPQEEDLQQVETKR